MYAIWTTLDTRAALGTEGGMEQQLSMRGDALRVVAPCAMQRTPFHENRVPHTGTVMNGKSADCRNRNDGWCHGSALVCRFRNKGLLHLRGEIDEPHIPAAEAYLQVAVVLRVQLRVSQNFRREHIELDEQTAA